jgi:hypothetical protein
MILKGSTQFKLKGFKIIAPQNIELLLIKKTTYIGTLEVLKFHKPYILCCLIDCADATMVKTFYFIIHKILSSFKLMIMNINKNILHRRIILLQNQYTFVASTHNL